MERPDILADKHAQLTGVERFQIGFVRRTFEPGLLDRGVRWCQRNIGANWIVLVTGRLRHIHRIERLPELDPQKSYILVSNHRSFFDLYVVTAELVKRRLQHRIVFPVRSEFFYDRPLGLFVNGVMSFFAMYPPIYRERKRAALNLLSLDELTWMLGQGGVFLGIHPEGTRNKTDDPYTLLPAQSGVGRIIHRSEATVLPVFVNGLVNDLPKQITSNFDGSGTPVHIVFGEPIDFSDQRAQPGSPRLYREIAERACDVVAGLGREEKRHRAAATARD